MVDTSLVHLTHDAKLLGIGCVYLVSTENCGYRTVFDSAGNLDVKNLVLLYLAWGLIHRTLQLWVGKGSRAAEEKQFFDRHLAPFYRIEQVTVLFLRWHFFPWHRMWFCRFKWLILIIFLSSQAKRVLFIPYVAQLNFINNQALPHAVGQLWEERIYLISMWK